MSEAEFANGGGKLTLETLIEAKRLLEEMAEESPLRQVRYFKCHPASRKALLKAADLHEEPGMPFLGYQLRDDEKIPLGEFHGFDFEDRLCAISTAGKGVTVWKN